MNNESLKAIIDAVPQINSNRKYWMVRTQSGDYYRDFVKNEFIAIGWEEIELIDIKKLTSSETGLISLTEKIKKIYKNEQRPGYVATQLTRFVRDMKKGDIVIVPSINSNKVTFGEVALSATFVGQSKRSEDYIACPFSKRKRIDWLKTMSRDSLDPNLYQLMFSHHTITEAGDYAEYIDKIINSFFIKNDSAHLILDVQQSEQINATDIFSLGTSSIELLEEFCQEEGIEYDTSDVKVKLNLQSPGLIELSGSISSIVILGLIVVGIVGGGFTVKYSGQKTTMDVGLKTDGLIEKVRKFLVSKSNRQAKKKILEKNAENLKLKEPQDLVEVIKQLDKK